MTEPVVILTNEIGIRVIGRCFLPFRVTDRIDGGYDLSFYTRSNFGGLRHWVSLGVSLEYQKRNRQWVLRVKPSEQSSTLPFSLFKHFSTKSVLTSNQSLSLIKPNKHFLKRYNQSVYCKQGVLQVPILVKDELDLVLESTLFIYPSVINGKEFLVLDSSDLPIVVSR